MRKCNPVLLIILIAVYIAIGFALGIGIGALMGLPLKENWWPILTIPLFMILFVDLTNLILYPVAKKTMDKNLEKNSFVRVTRFTSTGRYALKSLLCIDEDTGRVAYVSVLNPFQFQVVNASELSKIRSSYIPGPFGGTRYVFFEFYQGKKRFRFPTFIVRHMWFASATAVQNAISTGNQLRDLLLKFNPGGNDFSIHSEIPFSKTGLWGFIFSFISLYFDIAALLSEGVVSQSDWRNNIGYAVLPLALCFIGLATAVTGLVLGIKVLIDANKTPARGVGFAKASVVMSSILIVILLITFFLFILG